MHKGMFWVAAAFGLLVGQWLTPPYVWVTIAGWMAWGVATVMADTRKKP